MFDYAYTIPEKRGLRLLLESGKTVLGDDLL